MTADDDDQHIYQGSDDLIKHLNSEILRKCPDLRHFMLQKNAHFNKTPL